MPRLWCAISDHGFGHAAQVTPVLQELDRRVTDLHVIIRTTISATFFAGRLDPMHWELSQGDQGGGCVQRGPLTIDIPATWEAYRHFHHRWEDRVAEEAAAMKDVRADLVLSDISYLAIEAAARAGIPAVGLSSLSWDRVLEGFGAPAHGDDGSLLQTVRAAYGQAELMIRPTPGVRLSAFRAVRSVGPIGRCISSDGSGLRKALGVTDSERIVLIAFGGVHLESLPFERLEAWPGYRFVVGGQVPAWSTRCHPAAMLPFSFPELVAWSDIVMTKPGYGTVVEAVVHQKPVVYVRRYTFVDEPSLVAFLHQFGRAVELSADDFTKGFWEDALDAVTAQPPPLLDVPSPTGAAEAAAILSTYF